MKYIINLTLLLLLSSLAFGQNGKFTELQHKCKDGKERPFIIYTPNSVQKSESRPLLVYLHGGISSPLLKKDPLAYMQKSKLIALADEGKFHLLFSYGQKGATWFDKVGINMVLSEIKTAEKKRNVNPNKIFLSGFSDGGSGVFYMAMTNPFPFAGFIAMNGSIAVAQKLGGQKLFLENTNTLPMYIVNTTQDMLYPLDQITPTIDYLKKYNQHIIFKTPKANHEMSYLDAEKADLLTFINANSKPNFEAISWETSIPNDSSLWIRNIKIDTLLTAKDWHNPYKLKVFNQKAKFGLKYDYRYRGKGLKVKGFKRKNCTAEKMGIQKDDIILAVEKDTVTSPYTPFMYLARKKAGDATTVTILRNNEEKILTGNFNDGYYYTVFDNTTPTGKIKAVIKKRKLFINTSRIASFEIDLDKLKPLKIRRVIVNNKTLHCKKRGVLKIDTTEK